MKKLLTKLLRKYSAWAWQAEIDFHDSCVIIEKLTLEEGGIEMHLKQRPELATLQATALAMIVDQAPNYCEMNFQTMNPLHDDDYLIVTIQKGRGKTPNQLKVAAELELARLKAQIECK